MVLWFLSTYPRSEVVMVEDTEILEPGTSKMVHVCQTLPLLRHD